MTQSLPQLFSHNPAIPPPVPVRLWESPAHPCSYLPNRNASMRAILTHDMPAETYHAFMDANFRRSGSIVYQPNCAGCRACQSLRVVTCELAMSKSQWRCWRGNSDVVVSVNSPIATDEKFQMYKRYLAEWHGRDDDSYDEFRDFLYESPVDTIEFEYRDASQKLLAVGICDRSTQSLSSVYFYFDPSERKRSPGTFGALWEIQWAAKEGIPFYYLGYWVDGCASMEYKASFHPHQILGTDGVWRSHGKKSTRHAAP